jgi:hypothetical protein
VNAALVTAVGVLVTAVVGLMASRAQVAKLRADIALTTETVSDRQTARLEAEIDRQGKVIEYLRNDLRDCDRKVRLHREGWWRTYRLATMAGVDLPEEAQPPINGEAS